MKFFSLISKDEIRAAPEKKVIPEKEFSKLMDADEILKKIKEETKQHKKELSEEAEEIKNKAYDEGFEEGLQIFNEHIMMLDKKLKSVEKELEKKILPIALQAARKVVGEELKVHPNRVTDIVIQALKPVIQHHHIRIYANKADMHILESSKAKIRKILPQVEALSIQERPDVQQGGCIIETEAGIINAQLDNQWRALEAAFQSFMKK